MLSNNFWQIADSKNLYKFVSTKIISFGIHICIECLAKVTCLNTKASIYLF